MIITIISFTVLLLGIILFLLGKIGRKQCWKNNFIEDHFLGKFYWICYQTFYDNIINYILIAIGAAFSFVSCYGIIGNAINKNLDFEKTLHNKQIIEYRIEHKNENIVGNELLYDDIIAFNNDLRKIKCWSNNPWTSWFWNDKIAQLDYIEYEFVED